MTNKNDFYNNDFINIDGNEVHITAIINDNVIMGTGNRIGAYTVIGANGEMRNVDQNSFEGKIVIGNNNVISEHVTIQVPYNKDAITKIGNNNIIMAHSHIGHDGIVGDNTEICTTSIIGGYATVKNGAKIIPKADSPTKPITKKFKTLLARDQAS